MRLHCIQHVPFEGLASIETWAAQRSSAITGTRMWLEEPLPAMHDLDWLVVMGGPMGVYEEAQYPWLAAEIDFIADAIHRGKTVLGICLGAQLIAAAMGARVYPGPNREIGWWQVELTEQAGKTDMSDFLPSPLTVLQWHGDTFDLPRGAIPLARGDLVENQAFLYDGRVLGLQFHLESTYDSLVELATHCGDEIAAGGERVQTADEILAAAPAMCRQCNKYMWAMLEHLPT